MYFWLQFNHENSEALFLIIKAALSIIDEYTNSLRSVTCLTHDTGLRMADYFI
jgi:hypothetical protein